MTTPLAPPALAQPGQPYLLSFAAYSFEGGDPVDPVGLSLDITYGGYVQLVPDYAGPFVYQNADPTQAGPNVLWRTDVGQYTFQWQVPASIPAGVYTANWTWTYGDDTFLAAENFTVPEGGPFGVVPPVDVGFWTGSLSYQPAWASAPFVIPFGGVDANGVAWILLSVTGWDGPPTVGQIVQRSADHGGWPSAQYYGPRLITLDVLISAPDQASRDVAKQQLIQACPVSDLATFTYNEPVPKLAYVRQNGSAQHPRSSPRRWRHGSHHPAGRPRPPQIRDDAADGNRDPAATGPEPADVAADVADRVPRLGAACGLGDHVHQQRHVRDEADHHGHGPDQRPEHCERCDRAGHHLDRPEHGRQ